MNFNTYIILYIYIYSDHGILLDDDCNSCSYLTQPLHTVTVHILMPWSSDIYTLLNACMGTSILTYIKLSSQYSNSRHMDRFVHDRGCGLLGTPPSFAVTSRGLIRLVSSFRIAPKLYSSAPHGHGPPSCNVTSCSDSDLLRACSQLARAFTQGEWYHCMKMWFTPTACIYTDLTSN